MTDHSSTPSTPPSPADDAGSPYPPVGAGSPYPAQSYGGPPSAPGSAPPGYPSAPGSAPPGYPSAPGSAPPGYPSAPGFPPPGHPGGAAPARPGTNGWAIASLILGLIGGWLLGLIFGIVALVQTKRRPQRGRGLAIAGIALSVFWLIAIASLIVWAIASEPTRDSAGNVTEAGSTSVNSLRPGDCVNELKESTAVLNLPVVPCATAHEGEVFAVFDLPAGPWPGNEAVTRQTEQGCTNRLAAYSPKAADDTSVELFSLYPQESSWSQSRTVTCIAMGTGGPRTGSLRD